MELKRDQKRSQREVLGVFSVFDPDPALAPGPTAKNYASYRACTNCRRLKMKCVGAEQSPPCKRCLTGNHECIFEESNRGKRSNK